jgi:phage tail sheath gpL-like
MVAIINPKITFSIIPAEQILRVRDQKVLIVGQMLPTGTAAIDKLVTDIPNDGSEDTLFGAKSHIAGMVRAFKKENKITRLDALPLGAPTGTPGGGAFDIDTITAPVAGTLTISIGSLKDYVYSVSFPQGEPRADIVADMKALIDADPYAPFVSGAGTEEVIVDSNQHGTIFSDWDLRILENTANLLISIPSGGWVDGTGLNTIPDLNSVLGNIRYQTIVWASGLDMTTLISFLNARFNSVNAILDGVGIQTKKGTLAELKTYADQNSQSIVVVGNQTIEYPYRRGVAIPEMPDIISSKVAAIRSLRLTDGALLSDYVVSKASLDQYGGIGIASLPYFNTRIPNVELGYEQDMWSSEDQEELINSGVALIGSNANFSEIIFGTQVTTYLTDSVGNQDISYKYLNTVDIASIIREFFDINCRSRYAQTRLTDGDLIPGKDFANESSIRTFLNELYDNLADDGLVQKGRSAKKDFNDNLSILIDVREGKATIDMAPLLVSQLRIILGTIQINFGS